MPEQIGFDVSSGSEGPLVKLLVGSDEHPVSPIWLRERCQDDESVDARTKQRLFNPHDLPLDLKITDASVAGGKLTVSFSDGYCGEYAPTGLVDDFDDNDGCPEPMAWTSGTLGDVRVDWRSTEDPEGLREALRKFLTYGFVIVHDSPVRDLAVIEVAERFGKVRDTNFGRHFEVYARPNPEDANDLAYTALRLDPHTDNPYRDPVPGIQLLHCLVNESSGGLSTLADSIAVTDELSRAHPEGFRLLCEVPIRYRFWDRDAELVKRHPMISVSAHGKVTGIHYSPKLDFLPLLPHDQVLAYHEARQLLSKLLVDDRFEYRFTLQSGEAMMFDNNRVLHGRTSFDPGVGMRHLQGCYIDRDQPKSTYRVLTRPQES